MPCNNCEVHFRNAQPIVLTISVSGNEARLYVQNHGRNIVLLRLIVLCYTTPTGGYGRIHLRPPPDSVSWAWHSPYLEPGLTALFHTISLPSGYTVQAQAEYVELTGRSRSCTETI